MLTSLTIRVYRAVVRLRDSRLMFCSQTRRGLDMVTGDEWEYALRVPRSKRVLRRVDRLRSQAYALNARAERRESSGFGGHGWFAWPSYTVADPFGEDIPF